MPMVDIDWLKDHVEVPEGLTYEQLAKDLVKVGLEEEEIHTSQLWLSPNPSSRSEAHMPLEIWP